MQLASIASLELSTPLIFINSRSHTDSPGIVPSHPEDALRTLQILLPYITSNKWFAAKINPLKLPVIYSTKFRIYPVTPIVKPQRFLFAASIFGQRTSTPDAPPSGSGDPLKDFLC
ncbi:hypothetical protein EYX89_06925 [Escherichia coli]|nr:hypothetical protein EYX89_06925 [Escherichia coli]